MLVNLTTNTQSLFNTSKNARILSHSDVKFTHMNYQEPSIETSFYSIALANHQHKYHHHELVILL